MVKNVPAVWYVYANKTYQEEIETYLSSHFSDVSTLTFSNSTGVGYKIISYDIGEIKTLDSFLEQYEGWVQQTRRNEFSDMETDFLDLDKYIAGCNRRITFDADSDSDSNILKLNWRVNAHKKIVAMRELNLMSNTTEPGRYTLKMADDTISGGVPVGATIANTRIYRKNLKGEDFSFKIENCDCEGFIFEIKGDEMRSLGYETTTLNMTNFSNAQDNDYSTRWSPTLYGNGSSGYHDYVGLKSPYGELYKETELEYTKLNMIISFEDDNFLGDRYDVNMVVQTQTRNYDSFSPSTTIYDEDIETKIAAIADEDSYISIPITQPFNRINIFFWLPSVSYVGHTTVHIWEMFLS